MRRDGKILVVEDNVAIATAIASECEQMCVTIDCATDGWDAIEKLENEDYAAIVIDADVPRHSGFGVLTYLREEVGDALQNVILLTSSDQDEVRRKVGSNLTVTDRAGAAAQIKRVVRSDED